MKHVVFPSLFLAAIIAAPPVLRAQETAPSDTQAAIEAAVKREATRQDARKFIEQGRKFEAQRDTLAAAQEFNKALQALRQIGGIVEPEHTNAVAGLARTTLTLADQERRRNNFAVAKAHIDRVLAEDPQNKLPL